MNCSRRQVVGSVWHARARSFAQDRICAESDQCATLEQVHEPCGTEGRRDPRDSRTEVKSASVFPSGGSRLAGLPVLQLGGPYLAGWALGDTYQGGECVSGFQAVTFPGGLQRWPGAAPRGSTSPAASVRLAPEGTRAPAAVSSHSMPPSERASTCGRQCGSSSL